MSEREPISNKKPRPLPRDLVSANSLTRNDIDRIFDLADVYRETMEGRHIRQLDDLNKHLIYLAFFEPSTRTRLSFATAAFRLGATTIVHEATGGRSSSEKGESFEDTIAVLDRYRPDAIVLRHPVRGIAADAAERLRAPIINAGDGDGEHPSQALMDLFTILNPVEKRVGTERLNVVLCGDLKYGRTVHSLCALVAKFWPDGDSQIRFILCSPETLQVPIDTFAILKEARVPFDLTNNLEQALQDADVLYQTRVQTERMKKDSAEDRAAAEEAARRFRIEKRHLDLLKPTAMVMHPMPIVNEIDRKVFDADPRAKYLTEQVGNGIYVRMALLRWVLRPDLDANSTASQP